jgi:hypothetical protein
MLVAYRWHTGYGILNNSAFFIYIWRSCFDLPYVLRNSTSMSLLWYVPTMKCTVVRSIAEGSSVVQARRSTRNSKRGVRGYRDPLHVGTALFT